MDANIPVSSWLSVTLRGSVGLAERVTALVSSDASFSTPNAGVSGSSTISPTAGTLAFAATAEGGFAVAATPTITLRAFGGLNFDNHVPGVAAPTYGSFLAQTPIPASIFLTPETSYYAGGGMTVRF
jgi:hypothetical protein